MATGGTNRVVKGLGAGEMQWVGPFQLVDESGAEMFGVTSAGVITSAGAQTQSGNLTVSNTAPSLTLADTTASAKDLVIAVDADKAQLREAAGAAGSLLVLDLANNRVGVGVAAPTVGLDVAGAATVAGAVIAQATLNVSGVATFGASPIIPTATPASAGAAGTAGTVAWDGNYVYVCVATNTWKRSALSSWP